MNPRDLAKAQELRAIGRSYPKIALALECSLFKVYSALNPDRPCVRNRHKNYDPGPEVYISVECIECGKEFLAALSRVKYSKRFTSRCKHCGCVQGWYTKLEKRNAQLSTTEMSNLPRSNAPLELVRTSE